jgi:hypothetical protein
MAIVERYYPEDQIPVRALPGRKSVREQAIE